MIDSKADKKCTLELGRRSMESVRIGAAQLHMWEEPCISGEKGSGAVFFCGCNLKCVYCQNTNISRGKMGYGHSVSVEELADELLRLQDLGANNINLVTAGHYMKRVTKALEMAKGRGLSIPIVYNTSSYEAVDAIKALEGLVDVYLPDLKYVSRDLSLKYSGKGDYFDVAAAAIAEMVRQQPVAAFYEEGKPGALFDKNDYNELSDDKSLIMKNGVVVRHLILPGYCNDSKNVIKYLLDAYGGDIFISIMSQYTPLKWVEKDYPELNRRITEAEYDEVLDFALEQGLEYGFFQDMDVAEESFIPSFK